MSLYGAITIALFILTLAVSIHAMPTGHELDRWKALSQIETRDDDWASGASGEISRYAITPRVWKQYAGTVQSFAATNPFTAIQVGEACMIDRCGKFERKNHRRPTDAEWPMLWHAPARLKTPTLADRDYTARFLNILNRREK